MGSASRCRRLTKRVRAAGLLRGQVLGRVIYGVTIGLAAVAIGFALGMLALVLSSGKSRRKRF